MCSVSPNSQTISSSGTLCVICQGTIEETQIQEETEHVRNKNIPLVQQLEYQTQHSRIRELQLIKLPCSHVFHRECLVKWIHFDNTSCPMCRAQINLPGLDKITWKLNNIAMRTRCSPESLKLGMQPDGWFNVEIQIVPPPGRHVQQIRYVFHPAFSLNKLDVKSPPYDLIMKLVSNSVVLVIDVTLDGGKHFTFVHQISKDMCTRTYYEDMYNGTDDSTEISAIDYFSGQLRQYNRDHDYYVKEMPPPPRFQNRNRPHKRRGFFRWLLGGFIHGW